MKATKPLRVARWLLVACFAPVLIYLLGANLFLRFGLPLVFRSTNTVNATVASAWTVWPGVVHVRSARIVFQDYNLQWSLDLEQVTVELRLRELLSKTFHATKVAGTGVVFRMRNRIDPQSKTAPWVATLPPIPEFPAPAVFEARVPEAPLSDADYNLWTVHLENVDVGVREAWAHFVRFRGEGRAQGAFRLRPARELWVRPASLVLDHGTVTLGSEQLAQSLSGSVTCVVDPFDVRVPDGREVFRFISTGLELRGQGVTPDPVVKLFFADSGLSLDTTPGTWRLSARVKRGKFDPGGSLEFQSPAVRARFREFRFDATQLGALVTSQAGEQVESSLRFSRAELSSSSTPAKPAVLRGVQATALTSGLDAAGSAALLERRLRLEQIEVSDARLLNAFGNRKVQFTSGALEFALQSSERDGKLEASTQGQVRKVVVKSGRTELRLSGHVNGELMNARVQQGSGALRFDAELSRSQFNSFEQSQQGFSLIEEDGLRLKARIERDSRGEVRSQFRVASASASLSRIEANSRHPLASWKGLSVKGVLRQSRRGLIDGTLSAHSSEARALLGATWLRARPNLTLAVSQFDPATESGQVVSELSLEQGSAVSARGSDCPWGTLPDARVRSTLSFTRETAEATTHATLSEARFTWGDFHASGKVELDARIDASDRQRGLGTLDFSVSARGVTLKSGEGENQGWASQIPELVASGKLQSNPKLSGTLAVSAPQNQTRIGLTHLQTDFNAKTALSSLDLERREARFSGKFSVSNAKLSAGEQRIDGWWANIRADSALLIARDNVDLSVPFRAELRDGQPGIAILAAQGSLPGLIADAVPLNGIAVVGAVQRRCRLTNIRFTQASGGPLLGRGLLNSTSDSVRGAFLLRLSDLEAISAGVALDSGNSAESGVKFLAGDDWLRKRTEALDDNARRILDEPCQTPPAECSAAASGG